MTTVNDLRARFDAEQAREQHHHSAALKGAVLAFNNPGRPEYPRPSTAGRADANTAANIAGTAQRPPPTPLPLRPQTSNASYIAAQSTFRPQSVLPSPSVTSEADIHPWYRVGIRRGSSNTLLTPLPAEERVKSPSSIAASLAAARHSPQKLDSPLHKTSHQPTRQSRVVSENDPEPEEHLPPEGAVRGVRRWLQSIEQHDEDPVPPENPSRVIDPKLAADVSMVRSKPIDITLHSASPEAVLGAQGSPPRILSPKPVRTSSAAARSINAASRAAMRLQASASTGLGASSDPQASDAGKVAQVPASPPSPDATSFMQLQSRRLRPDIRPAASEPQLNLALAAARADQRSRQAAPSPEPRPSLALAAAKVEPKTRPEPPPTRRSKLDSEAATAASRNVLEGPVLLSDSRPIDTRPSLYHNLSSLTTIRSPISINTSVTPPDFPSRRLTPHMTGDSLVSAIVGASLASSRAPSPAKDLRPSLPPRRKTSPHVPFQNHKQRNPHSRKGSPSKGFKYTMRADDSSTSEEERPFHKKPGHFGFRKHPNKHHEGDRKRWRDVITERERKRYEGVWAANKGIHIAAEAQEGAVPPAVLAESVNNIVVRDIWSRSRLPGHVLEEIWDLVDRQGVRRLSREEFVVGLWLVDQRLKGRKLPVQVSQSIWRSVVGIYGLKVPKIKDHH